MRKQAFTLTELAIVLIVIGIVMGGVINYSSAAYTQHQFESAESELESIKTSLIAYAATNGKLPYPDTTDDGEGDTIATLPTTLSKLPYIDLQEKANDPYSMSYYYDVSDTLVDSDDSNICARLKTLAQSTTALPQVGDDQATPNTYPVAAVIISSGDDKILTGQNLATDTDRVYEMAQNQYDDTTNNDIVIELSAYELMGNICDLASFIN